MKINAIYKDYCLCPHDRQMREGRDTTLTLDVADIKGFPSLCHPIINATVAAMNGAKLVLPLVDTAVWLFPVLLTTCISLTC